MRFRQLQVELNSSSQRHHYHFPGLHSRFPEEVVAEGRGTAGNPRIRLNKYTYSGTLDSCNGDFYKGRKMETYRRLRVCHTEERGIEPRQVILEVVAGLDVTLAYISAKPKPTLTTLGHREKDLLFLSWKIRGGKRPRGSTSPCERLPGLLEQLPACRRNWIHWWRLLGPSSPFQ